MVVLLVVAGCAKPGRDTFAEAEALEAQGKAEEAARRFDLACAFAPAGENCASSDKRAAEARLKAVDKAMSAGQFLAAERLATLAFACLDGPTAQLAKERLGSGDLLQGIAYERALARGTPREIREAMEPIALEAREQRRRAFRQALDLDPTGGEAGGDPRVRREGLVERAIDGHRQQRSGEREIGALGAEARGAGEERRGIVG